MSEELSRKGFLKSAAVNETGTRICSRRDLIRGAATLALGGAALGSGALLSGCTSAGSSNTKIPDGEYVGKAPGRSGDVTVNLTVAKNCVVKAMVTEHFETPTLSDFAIARVTSDIVTYQTFGVDTVTGATLLSMGVKNAAANALKQASKDISEYEKEVVSPKKAVEDCATDVVVIGAGSSGMMAATQAVLNGAKVILVEKQGFLGGGDSMFASSGFSHGGGYPVYKKKLTKNSDADYYASKAATAKKSGYPVDMANLAAYCALGGEAVDHYISIGVPFGNYSASFNDSMLDGSAPGTHVIHRLAEQMDVLGVDYRVDTKLSSIVTKNGKVTGVVVSTKAGNYTISAKSVVLACGGFANNSEMLVKYAEAADYAVLPKSGSASAKGEGILAAKEIGAEIYNMTAIKANNMCNVSSSGAVTSLHPISSTHLIVNNAGRRFINEDLTPHVKSAAQLKLPNKEAWAITDQSCVDDKAVVKHYVDLGYFVKGDTLEQLATKMGFSATASAAFVETMKKYQSTPLGTKDKEFGAMVDNAITKAPFYASRLTPAMQSTYGGVRTDASARAIDTSGKVIPGLYACGAVSGHGCFGNGVGNGFTIAGTFGMIAGRTAAKESKI